MILSRTIISTFALLLLLRFAHSQVVSEDQIRLTTPSAPWTIVITGSRLDITQVKLKPGSTSLYAMMVDETNKLNASIYIEPSDKCKTSDECRDFVLNAGNPAWGKFQDLAKSRIGEFSYFEFYRPEAMGQPLKMQDMYAQYVANGYWVDLHISKVLYTKADHQLFENVVKSLKFIPKSSTPDAGSVVASDLQKIAESWLAVWGAGKCKESFDALTSFSREAVSQAKWVEYCQTNNAAVGKFRSRKPVATVLMKSLSIKPGHSAANFRFESSFENYPLVTEFVSLTQEKDGRWTVSNYRLQ